MLYWKDFNVHMNSNFLNRVKTISRPEIKPNAENNQMSYRPYFTLQKLHLYVIKLALFKSLKFLVIDKLSKLLKMIINFINEWKYNNYSHYILINTYKNRNMKKLNYIRCFIFNLTMVTLRNYEHTNQLLFHPIFMKKKIAFISHWIVL